MRRKTKDWWPRESCLNKLSAGAGPKTRKGKTPTAQVNVFVVVLPVMGSRVDRRHRYRLDRCLVLTAGGIGGESANRLLPTSVFQINTEVKANSFFAGCHHKDTETQRSGSLMLSIHLRRAARPL